MTVVGVSRSMRPLAKLVAYGLDGNAVIVQEFDSKRGWIKSGWRKRASMSYLRKLQGAGITHVAFRTTRDTIADFSIRELLSYAHKQGPE